MTEGQMLRMERRMLMEQHRRERRAEAIRCALIIVMMLIVFAIAGTIDYQDRMNSLNGMLPSATWWEVG